MSNCIYIYNPTVQFKPSEINISGLLSLLNSVKTITDSKDLDLLTPDQCMAWWYLTGNTSYVNGKLYIHFGQGRSSHTWRDFRGTLRVLSKFVIQPKSNIFTMSDEYDGHKTRFHCIVDFKKGDVIE
jgi:hypothetical protein